MDVTGATWRTSSYTGSGGGNCVEVGDQTGEGRVLVRDTKDRRGPVLALDPSPGGSSPPRSRISAHNATQRRERCAGS
jgi:hypothetical protein